MKNQPSIIWQGDNLVIVGDDLKPHTINKNTHQNYMDIVKCIQEKRWEDIADLLDVRKTVKSWSQGKITIDKDRNAVKPAVILEMKNGVPTYVTTIAP